jgi:hypothetical protein
MLRLAGILVTGLLFIGCGSGSNTKDVDAGDVQDAGDSDAMPGNLDAGDVQDARGSDAMPGKPDAGNMQDANDSDATPGNLDAGDMQDAQVPGGTGVEDCVTACETFLMTNCSTPAADFCENAQQNCEARYVTHANCQADLEVMDACAATQPVPNFVCPLGTIPNEAAPYNLTEDVCVREAFDLNSCLGG